MSVQCYALYQQPIKETTFINDIVYDFALLTLVQPTQRGKHVPNPRWQITEILHTYTRRQLNIRRRAIRSRNEDYSIRYEGTLFRLYDNQSIPLLAISEAIYNGDLDPPKLIATYEKIIKISEKNVQLNQIRILFPETKTMPFNIALDYVRERCDAEKT